MFPSEDALLPEQLDLQRTRRVIVIDSKWAKARELNQHPALQGMPRVRTGSWLAAAASARQLRARLCACVHACSRSCLLCALSAAPLRR